MRAIFQQETNKSQHKDLPSNVNELRSQTSSAMRSADSNVLGGTIGIMRVNNVLKAVMGLGIADAKLRQVKGQ